jgi:uncharacterized protein YvpB
MKRLVEVFVLVSILILVDVSSAAGDALPEAAYVSGVIGHAQSYTLSCEARSAADLASFWGVYVTETQFLQALPRTDNPEKGFVGNPNDRWGDIPPNSYGVYASPVAKALNDFGIQAEALKHLSWNDLRSQISEGNPVIVWVIGKMWPGTPQHYKASDGSTTVVAAYEHTMLLTGYNTDTIQVVNASDGAYQTYRLSDFLTSWSVLGNMAVFASPLEVEPYVEPVETASGSYTVQPGDYLMALARRFGTPWLELAELNSLFYPYIIHPGQTLYFPSHSAQEGESEVETSQDQPASEGAIYQTRLPIIQQNSGMISQGKALELDKFLLEQLADLLGPHLINLTQLTK